MSSKKKDLLKPKSKLKAKTQEPQSENDFLEVADEFEKSAGKWRAGDAAKATRFFNRAIDMYNVGLQRYPNSFDLAYNKANLEYTMSEDDRIVPLLGNKIDLLEETLRSHRAAIFLNPDNIDALFNTGQVLTSLAEALLVNGAQETTKIPASTLLEEAVDIFTKCLASQEYEYAQIQSEIAKVKESQEYQETLDAERNSIAEAMGQDSKETSSTSSETPGDWATVIEPVTPETILETCTAQLGALTALLDFYPPGDLTRIETRAQYGLETASTKIPALINLLKDSPLSSNPTDEPAPGPTLSIASSSAAEKPKASTKDDALLAAANFHVSIAGVAYRSGRSIAVQYANQIEQIFSSLIQGPENHTNFLADARSAYADALIDLASAIADSTQYTISSSTFLTDLECQWTALTQAQTILTQQSSGTYTAILSPSRLADIFLARGDTDLFRFRLSLFEVAKPAWVKSKITLVSNAGVFYRGARSYAEKAGAAELQKITHAKAIVAEIMKEAASGSDARKEHWKGKGAEVLSVLEEMVEEGIVGKENAEGVVRYTD